MVVVDLAAHAADIDVDDVGGRVKIEIPDVLQQHRPRHHLTLVADQIFEDLEFPRQQIDFLAAAIGGPRHQIELEIADAQHRFLDHRGAAPRQRLDPRQQLGKGERLDQIIVAAAAQAAHAVVDFAERADDQSRRINAGVAELPDDRQTVDAGKHAIDCQHGIGGGKPEMQSVVAVERQIDLIAARAEKIDQLPSRFQIVLNNQDAAPRRCHRPLLRPNPESS